MPEVAQAGQTGDRQWLPVLFPGAPANKREDECEAIAVCIMREISTYPRGAESKYTLATSRLFQRF